VINGARAEISGSRGDPSYVIHAHRLHVYLCEGRYAEAERTLQQALSLYLALGCEADAGRVEAALNTSEG
jgi:hypothetical protein